jgi:hypothetical protein
VVKKVNFVVWKINESEIDTVAAMIRMGVRFTQGQYEALKRKARRDRISLSAAIREAVDLWLNRSDRDAAIARSLASVGRYRSGKKDISRRHDEELARIHGGDLKGMKDPR